MKKQTVNHQYQVESSLLTAYPGSETEDVIFESFLQKALSVFLQTEHNHLVLCALSLKGTHMPARGWGGGGGGGGTFQCSLILRPNRTVESTYSANGLVLSLYPSFCFPQVVKAWQAPGNGG